MRLTDMIQPAGWGLAIGAGLCALIGFSWGGWVTSGKAKEIATSQTEAEVARVMTPYCVIVAKADPAFGTVFGTLKDKSEYDRWKAVAAAGWATPSGADAPLPALARACSLKLSETA